MKVKRWVRYYQRKDGTVVKGYVRYFYAKKELALKKIKEGEWLRA